MNKTRMRRLVEMAAMLAVLGMISMFHPQVAYASGGQCKWEGGNGADPVTHEPRQCVVEDCKGNGGNAECNKGEGASSVSTGPDGWVYSACPEAAASIPLDA